MGAAAVPSALVERCTITWPSIRGTLNAPSPPPSRGVELTGNAVPVATTLAPDTWTTKGRPDSFATSNSASPRRTFTVRWTSVSSTLTLVDVFSVIREPSASMTARSASSLVALGECTATSLPSRW